MSATRQPSKPKIADAVFLGMILFSVVGLIYAWLR